MVSAVLSDNEITNQALRSQRNFGFSFVTAIALHLVVFVAFINFSFNAEPPQLMMPASPVINATFVMAPKVTVQPRPVQAPQVVQKAKPVRSPTPKPQPRKLVRKTPKPVPAVQPEPQPVVETVQEPFEIQAEEAAPAEIEAVAAPLDTSMAEESYVPPSSNVAYFHNPKPRYPGAAKRRGMEGVVELRVMVDSSGQPTTMEVKQSSGFQVLDREAIKAVWQWRFQAAKRAGVAVAGEVIVPVRFQLDSA